MLLEVGCLSTAVPQSGACDNLLSGRLLDSANKEFTDTSVTCFYRARAGMFKSHRPIFHGQLLSFQLMKFWTHILVFLVIAGVN